MFMDDGWSTEDKNGRQPIALGQLSDSGYLKTLTFVGDVFCGRRLPLNSIPMVQKHFFLNTEVPSKAFNIKW